MSEVPPTETVSQTKDSIFKGSKSFALASLFFNKQQRLGSWALYDWCRHVDDEIDFARADEIQSRLKEVETRTRQAVSSQIVHGPYGNLSWAVQTFSIHPQYSLDLLKGLEIDSLGATIETSDDLLKYCYYVAGTVGLMMCAVMGVRHKEARLHADALGKAMQLTNIARDIHEDLQRNRVYVPQSWLQKDNLTHEDFKRNPACRIPYVRQLLDLSEHHYAQGFSGIRYLPFRAALAVSAAAYIYRAIGLKIRRNPELHLHQRAVVPFYEKLYWLFRGFLFTLRTRGFQWKSKIPS